MVVIGTFSSVAKMDRRWLGLVMDMGVRLTHNFTKVMQKNKIEEFNENHGRGNVIESGARQYNVIFLTKII